MENMKEEHKLLRKESLSNHREWLKTQDKKVYELKIDYSHLNKEEKNKLRMFFLEAKWLYNYILSQEDLFNFDTKKINIQVRNKDKIFEDRKLLFLPAKNRQDIHNRIMRQIIDLNRNKKLGNKVGRLKFKSRIECIDLSQYGTTHKITGRNRVKINGIKRPLIVRGLKQITDEHTLGKACLIQKASGYYIKITCFKNKEKEVNYEKDLGLDMGIKTTVHTSEDKSYSISFAENQRLKRLQRKILRNSKKNSNNRYKLRQKLQKEYETLTNKRKDKANKFIHDCGII